MKTRTSRQFTLKPQVSIALASTFCLSASLGHCAPGPTTNNQNKVVKPPSSPSVGTTAGQQLGTPGVSAAAGVSTPALNNQPIQAQPVGNNLHGLGLENVQQNIETGQQGLQQAGLTGNGTPILPSDRHSAGDRPTTVGGSSSGSNTEEPFYDSSLTNNFFDVGTEGTTSTVTVEPDGTVVTTDTHHDGAQTTTTTHPDGSSDGSAGGPPSSSGGSSSGNSGSSSSGSSSGGSSGDSGQSSGNPSGGSTGSGVFAPSEINPFGRYGSGAVDTGIQNNIGNGINELGANLLQNSSLGADNALGNVSVRSLRPGDGTGKGPRTLGAGSVLGGSSNRTPTPEARNGKLNTQSSVNSFSPSVSSPFAGGNFKQGFSAGQVNNPASTLHTDTARININSLPGNRLNSSLTGVESLVPHGGLPASANLNGNSRIPGANLGGNLSGAVPAGIRGGLPGGSTGFRGGLPAGLTPGNGAGFNRVPTSFTGGFSGLKQTTPSPAGGAGLGRLPSAAPVQAPSQAAGGATKTPVIQRLGR